MSQTAPPVARTKFAIDVALGAGLLGALLIVYISDVSRPQRAPTAVAATLVEVQQVEEVVDTTPPLRMAVTRGQYDDLGRLLKQLGEAYSNFETIPIDALLDSEMLSKYDVLFLTCGVVPDAWTESVVGDAARPGVVNVTLKDDVVQRVRQNIRRFVERGGTLYASDFRYGMVVIAFEEFAAPQFIAEGKQQTVTAEVDDSLHGIVGKSLSLRFDMDGWRPAAFGGDKLSVLLRGEFETIDGKRMEAPLLVKFPVGEGTVIFTSFHNEKQNNEVEQQLLKALVFATMLARTESRLTKTLVQGGFSPVNNSLLTAAAGQQSVTSTHRTTKAGKLLFAIGFENRGANLKLTVTSPDGQQFEQAGTSSFTLAAEAKTAGEWKYTITAVKTPYKDFPFSLTIGEK